MFVGLYASFCSIFVRKNSVKVSHYKCVLLKLTKLSLSNIMKHGESDVEQQISVQGIHTSALWNYFWKREGNFLS